MPASTLPLAEKEDHPEEEQEQKHDEASVIAAFQPPESALQGEWVCMNLRTLWASRKGRRGIADPAGGVSFEPMYGQEIRVAFPVVADPKTNPPEGSIRFDVFQQYLMLTMAGMIDKALVMNESNEQFA
jgi:hypothetical protein